MEWCWFFSQRNAQPDLEAISVNCIFCGRHITTPVVEGAGCIQTILFAQVPERAKLVVVHDVCLFEAIKDEVNFKWEWIRMVKVRG